MPALPRGEILPRAPVRRPESFPEKRKKREPVQIVLAAAVLFTPRGETLLLPPPGKKAENKPAADDVATLVSRMWHFPTIAVRADADAELRSFLGEFLGAKNGKFPLEPLAKVRHAVTYRSVTVLPFRVAISENATHPWRKKHSA